MKCCECSADTRLCQCAAAEREARAARAAPPRRDPYTVARELDAAIEDTAAAVHYGAPTHEVLAKLHQCGDLCRELRRAMVRRVEPINRTEESDNA